MNEIDNRMTVTEIADRLGVTSKTIIRWEQKEKIPKAKRDWRGWRVYFESDFREIRDFFETLA